jgi:hypothetical protein
MAFAESLGETHTHDRRQNFPAGDAKNVMDQLGCARERGHEPPRRAAGGGDRHCASETRQKRPLLVAVPAWDGGAYEGRKVRRKLLGRLGLSFLIDDTFGEFGEWPGPLLLLDPMFPAKA